MTAMVSLASSLYPWPDIEMPAALLTSTYSLPFRLTLTCVTEPPFKYTVTLYGLTLTVAVPDAGIDGVVGELDHSGLRISPPVVTSPILLASIETFPLISVGVFPVFPRNNLFTVKLFTVEDVPAYRVKIGVLGLL